MSRITRVKELRGELGLTQMGLAVKAGLSLGTVRHIEAASDLAELSQVGVGRLFELANALQTTPVGLMPSLENEGLPRGYNNSRE